MVCKSIVDIVWRGGRPLNDIENGVDKLQHSRYELMMKQYIALTYLCRTKIKHINMGTFNSASLCHYFVSRVLVTSVSRGTYRSVFKRMFELDTCH